MKVAAAADGVMSILNCSLVVVAAAVEVTCTAAEISVLAPTVGVARIGGDHVAFTYRVEAEAARSEYSTNASR